MAQRQRKGPPPKQGGGNTIFYIVLGIIALGGILAIGFALTGGGGGAATELVELDIADARTLYQQATPLRLGDDAAPVKIVEFGDFQCPGCGAFSLQVRPRVMPYVESGLAQLVYYDYPIAGAHPHAFLAARASRCAAEQELTGAEPGRPIGTPGENAAYWEYHDKLYQEQSEWASERQPPVDLFVDYAEELGLDTGAFRSCLRSDRFAEVVTANRMLGDQLGIRSTPTVLINNRMIQARTINDMGDALIRELEAEKVARGAAGAAAGTDTAAN